MLPIEFEVNNQVLTLTTDMTKASGSINYATVKFDFKTADWENVTKVATFHRFGMKPEKTIVSDEGLAIVPATIIKFAGEVHIGVYGFKGPTEDADDDLFVRITSTKVPVVWDSGAYYEIFGNNTPMAPSEYAQLLSLVGDKAARAADFKTPITRTNKGLTEADIEGIKNYVISEIANSASQVTVDPTLPTT